MTGLSFTGLYNGWFKLIQQWGAWKWWVWMGAAANMEIEDINCILGSGDWLSSFKASSKIKVSKSYWYLPLVWYVLASPQRKLICFTKHSQMPGNGERVQTHPFWPNSIANEACTHTYMCFLPLGLPSHLGGFRLPSESFNPPHLKARLEQQKKHTALSATFLPSTYQQAPKWLCLTSKVYWISCFSSSLSY